MKVSVIVVCCAAIIIPIQLESVWEDLAYVTLICRRTHITFVNTRVAVSLHGFSMERGVTYRSGGKGSNITGK